jgi:hypothetical protein
MTSRVEDGQARGACDDDLLQALTDEIALGRVRVCESCAPWFDKLNARFPASGSKIAWSEVPGSESSHGSIECFVQFAKDVVRFHGLTGSAVYIGDGLTNIAVLADVNDLLSIVDRMLIFPHHHYVVSESVDWCMSYTMEEDMDFGFAPAQGDVQAAI